MAQSPGYPNYPLAKAISQISKIFNSDRTNPIGRDVAARHIGYGGITGSSDKALATLVHYGLSEKAGKGQVKVTQTAVDILHPDKPETKRKALRKAAFNPAVFQRINESFSDGMPSEEALRSWLMRENFLDRAVNPVIKAYLETCQYLQQEKAFESVDLALGENVNFDEPSDNDVVYGEAKVGDFIQWERDGVLQMPAPARVRHVTDDGDWAFVDGSETGIPMSQTIVEQSADAPVAPLKATPIMPLATPPANDALPEGSFVLSSGKVKDVSFEVRVTGKINQRVIDRIIAYLELTKDDYEE